MVDIAATVEKKVILLGDFNCDFLTPRSRLQECKQLKSLFKFMDFKQFFTNATRIAQCSVFLLDIIA